MSIDHTQGKSESASTPEHDTRPTIGLTPEGFPIKDPEVLAKQLKAQGQAVTAAEDSNPDDTATDPTPFSDPDGQRIDNGSTIVPTEVQPPLAETDVPQDPQPKASEQKPSGQTSDGQLKKL